MQRRPCVQFYSPQAFQRSDQETPGDQSRYTAQKYRNMVYIDNLRKKDNQDFFFSLQILLEAVEEKCAVEFDYVQYNEKLQLVPAAPHPMSFSRFISSMRMRKHI